eukprot:Skav219310  [mRNA]  locus=scaffold1152:78144:81207:- [translate_table: standard]
MSSRIFNATGGVAAAKRLANISCGRRGVDVASADAQRLKTRNEESAETSAGAPNPAAIDASPVALGVPDQTAEVAQPFEFRVPEMVPTDLDASLADGSPLPSWLTFDPRKGSFTGTAPHATELGISIKGTSASKQSATTFLLKVGSGGGKPFVSGRLPQITATAGELFTATLPRVFTDPGGDMLSLSLSLEKGGALPDWLRFDPNVMLLSGVPDKEQDMQLSLTATNADGHSISTPLKLLVARSSQAVSSESPGLPEQTAEVAAPFTFQVPPAEGRFSGAALADGSALPSWLRFDPQHGLFTGTPNSASELAIELKAQQGVSEGQSRNFLLKAGQPIGQ